MLLPFHLHHLSIDLILERWSALMAQIAVLQRNDSCSLCMKILEASGGTLASSFKMLTETMLDLVQIEENFNDRCS